MSDYKADRNFMTGQLISPFGVGSLLDIGEEAFTVMDTSHWKPNRSKDIRLPRLESRIGKRLTQPPTENDLPNFWVKIDRFPRWMFCSNSSCRRMILWSAGDETGKAPQCPHCHSRKALVPMRFVVACSNGHLQEFPWYRWAHSRYKGDGCQYNSKNSLYFEISGRGSGLESLQVRCKCGAKRSLKGIVGAGSLKSIGHKCRGKQPWQSFEMSIPCDEKPVAVQRGASNVYYPTTASALDIPTNSFDSDCCEASIIEDELFSAAVALFLKNKVLLNEIILQMSSQLQISEERILRCVRQHASTTQKDSYSSDWHEQEEDVLREEWDVLSSSLEESSDGRYHAQRYSVDNNKINSPFVNINQIKRLREVRAFLGFHRIAPGDSKNRTSPDCGSDQKWVPAVEVFGEGIFIQFDESKVRQWENSLSSGLDASLQELDQFRRKQKFWFLPRPTPRFIALHTFAHVVIRQLAFESGYTASSLRERIYASSSMAGVLIYTADSDSEGSLGGLVRMGKKERLMDSIFLALERSRWCSTDPVCSETKGQGLGGFNRAACHACSLIPETSCAYANTMLDRSLLFGRSKDGLAGLFNDMLENA